MRTGSITVAIASLVALGGTYALINYALTNGSPKSPSNKKKRSKGKGSKGKNKEQRSAAPSLEEPYYVESNDLRRASSTATQSITAWIKENSKLLVHGVPNEDDEAPAALDDCFHVLSVGTADGQLDIQIIKALAEQLQASKQEEGGKGGKLHYVGLEPIPVYANRFKENLEKAKQMAELSPEVLAYVLEKRFEDKATTGNDSNGFNSKQLFDVVLMVNVMQYYRDPHAAVKKAMAQTKPGGRVMLLQPSAGVPGIQAATLNEVKGNEKFMFSGEDLKRLLTKNRMPFLYHQIDSHLNITDCLKKSYNGISIMSACLECDLRRLCEPKMMKVAQSFWSSAHIDEEGQAYIHEPVAVFVLEKPGAKKKEENQAD